MSTKMLMKLYLWMHSVNKKKTLTSKRSFEIFRLVLFGKG